MFHWLQETRVFNLFTYNEQKLLQIINNYPISIQRYEDWEDIKNLKFYKGYNQNKKKKWIKSAANTVQNFICFW